MSLRRAATAVLAAVLLAACGVKAPPRPPEKEAPPALPERAEPAACEAGCGAAPSTATSATR